MLLKVPDLFQIGGAGDSLSSRGIDSSFYIYD